jgi:PAS domain S-box-containing protein
MGASVTRVLIVEDDFLVSEMIQGVLEDMGYVVAGTATSGHQAIQMIRSIRPDVVLMDIGLPDIDGVEAMQRIYKSCPTPVVILTAHDTPELVERASTAGAGAYLVKPPSARDMERAITVTRARFNDMMALRRLNAELQAEIRERVQVAEALRKSEEFNRTLIEHSPIGVSVRSRTGRLLFYNEAWKKIWAMSDEEIRDDLDRVRPELVFDERDAYLEPYVDALRQVYQSGGSLHAPRLRTTRPRPGKAEWIEQYFYAIQDEHGQVDRVVILTEDITQREWAEEQIKASLREKEVLLQEIHHRVKNNLQIIHSLLDLQSDCIQDEQALRVFQESQKRVRAMALIHERLYQSKDLARVDFAEYIRNLSNDLFLSYGADAAGITLKINVGDVMLDIDTAIPCGLIINELVSNALKHAFPDGRAGEVCIDFYPHGDRQTLIVKNDGVGLPQSQDPRGTTSFGLRLVNMLIRQLGGAMEIDRSHGTTFRITFPRAALAER